jgi:hypothetical protein
MTYTAEHLRPLHGMCDCPIITQAQSWYTRKCNKVQGTIVYNHHRIAGLGLDIHMSKLSYLPSGWYNSRRGKGNYNRTCVNNKDMPTP